MQKWLHSFVDELRKIAELRSTPSSKAARLGLKPADETVADFATPSPSQVADYPGTKGSDPLYTSPAKVENAW